MRLEAPLAIDFLFKVSLGRLPYFRRYSPDIEILGNSEGVIRDLLQRELQRFAPEARPLFLDIGARDGTRDYLAAGYTYHAMDLNPRGPEVVAGDICSCPHIASDSYDVTFSLDVLEHLRRPWEAAEECVRITKPGGLLIHRSLFAYRYHPEPVDYWRFSSQCLEYLFTHGALASTILKGYDIRGRRRNRIGDHLIHRPPVDWLGGFRENWQVLWVGRKSAGDSSASAAQQEVPTDGLASGPSALRQGRG
jgi:SAM-dependent methyltransferase